jgi:hypothetical protein
MVSDCLETGVVVSNPVKKNDVFPRPQFFCLSCIGISMRRSPSKEPYEGSKQLILSELFLNRKRSLGLNLGKKK